jgi:hypothetical protein
MKYYLKMSYVNQDEIDGINVSSFGSNKACQKFQEVLVPMTATNPQEAAREYRKFFEIFKMLKKGGGSEMLRHIFRTAFRTVIIK